MRIETDLDGKVVGEIERHYIHACEKHPYFCDYIIPDYFTPEEADKELDEFREVLKTRIFFARHVSMLHVLRCEIAEMRNALAHADIAHAVQEVYDCIAVLLRTIDVLECRQSLGKPKDQGGKA